MSEESPQTAPTLAGTGAGCFRRLLTAIGLLLILFVFAVGGLVFYNLHELDKRRPLWQADVAAERARCAALRRPVPHGEALDENAADRYRAILTTFAGYDAQPLGAAWAGAVAGKALGPRALALVEAKREPIAALREATRCARCDWKRDYEGGIEAQTPSFVEARELAQLVVLEAFEHAAAGDSRGAVERCVDVVRFGRDFRESGTLMTVAAGVSIESIGLDGLGKLAKGDLPSPFPFAQAAGELAKLDAGLATAGEETASAIQAERRAVEALALQPPTASAPANGAPVSPSLLGWCLPGYDAAINDLARAAQVEPRAERATALEAARQGIVDSWNPIVKVVVPNFIWTREEFDQLVARRRVLESALAIEQKKTEAGYPKDSVGLELPDDPYAMTLAKLQYEGRPDGRGYKVWSVGPDEKIPPEKPSPYVFERKPKD